MTPYGLTPPGRVLPKREERCKRGTRLELQQTEPFLPEWLQKSTINVAIGQKLYKHCRPGCGL